MNLNFEKHWTMLFSDVQNPELKTVSCGKPIIGQQGALLPPVFRWVAQAAAATSVSNIVGCHERHEKALGGLATRYRSQEVTHITFVPE